MGSITIKKFNKSLCVSRAVIGDITMSLILVKLSLF